jgi:hypothetical protein
MPGACLFLVVGKSPHLWSICPQTRTRAEVTLLTGPKINCSLSQGLLNLFARFAVQDIFLVSKNSCAMNTLVLVSDFCLSNLNDTLIIFFVFFVLL